MNTIGQKIKKIREIKGFKQDYMADQLEISQQSYSNIESNKIDVPFSKITQIAEVFGMRIEDMVAFDEKFVFNMTGNHNMGYNNNPTIHMNFPEKVQQLYEEQILGLKLEVEYLKEIIGIAKGKKN